MTVRRLLLSIVVLGVAVAATITVSGLIVKPHALPQSRALQFQKAIAEKNLYVIKKRLSGCSPSELAQYGPYVNKQDSAGNTIMHQAAMSGDLSLTDLLVKAGAKVDVANTSARTPLLAVVGAYTDPDSGLVEEVLKFETYSERTDTVRWLLIHGASVNARDRNGDTALLLAVRAREWWKDASYKGNRAPVAPDYDRVIRVLVDTGADVNATNKKRQTAIEVARASKDLYTMKILSAHGARGRGGQSNDLKRLHR